MSESEPVTPLPVTPEPTPPPEFYAPPQPPRDEVFWGWHDVCLFVFITILALGAAMLAGMGLRSLFHISEVHMNTVFVLAQFAAYGASFTCLKVMFRAEYGEPLLPSLRWASAPVAPLRLALIGLGQAFAIAIVSSFLKVPELDTPMNRLLSDRPTAIVIAFLGVTAAPLAEELAFRGLLQPLLVRSIGAAPGIISTAILFGALHLEQYGSWQSVMLVALAGVGFGVMRHWSGSTRASAIMHAGYNSTLFLLFFSQNLGKSLHG
jgi:membrane protease YdiL (CAAX protease family)